MLIIYLFVTQRKIPPNQVERKLFPYKIVLECCYKKNSNSSPYSTHWTHMNKNKILYQGRCGNILLTGSDLGSGPLDRIDGPDPPLHHNTARQSDEAHHMNGPKSTGPYNYKLYLKSDEVYFNSVWRKSPPNPCLFSCQVG